MSRPDRGRSDFSPVVFLTGWAGGQAGQAHTGQRAHLHYLNPDRVHLLPHHTLPVKESSDPRLVNHFGLLWVVAELL